jgi:hypothetical protein
MKNKINLNLLDKISKEGGLKKFWLGGSIPYFNEAKKIGIRFEVNDYDLAILGGKREFEYCKKTLRRKGFEIIKARPYYLKFKKIHQIMAKKKNFLLDIAVLEKLDYLGHFNWECIFWEFPSKKIYDPYNSLKTISKRELRMVISPKEENPLILTSRFLKICARFNLNLHNDKRLNLLAKNLAKLVKKWDSKDYFHGEYAREHSYYGLFESIRRANNKREFIKQLEITGILKAFFPEIKKEIVWEKFELKNNSLKQIQDIVSFFRQNLVEETKSLEFDKKINLISKRLKKN